MKPERLTDDHVQVGKVLDGCVIEAWSLWRFERSVNLFLKTILDLGIFGQFVSYDEIYIY